MSDFQKAVKRFEEYFELKQGALEDDKYLTVKANHGLIRIPHEKILYVEAMGEYMKLILTDGLPELIYIRMKELEVTLGETFIRIHKSYLVNSRKINKLSGNEVTVGTEKLKVSRLYKKEIVKKLGKK